METEKKSRTSSAVKNRYNRKVYTPVIAMLPKETAAAFKEKCVREGIPQAQIVKKAVEEFLKN